MRPAAGIALGGRYRLDKLIAVGGMGEVWVAHDLSLRRSVAVKVLREEFAGDPGFLERFRTEARNAASLSHPNIAATYDYGEQSGSGYLVMELVDGEPMSDLLERQPVLPEARLLPVLAQTARALDAAHTVGVVHRDVKPGNILLGPGGRVKITDFGVSTAPDQAPMTATGMVMGTAQYLSPEQAVGRPATALSDLYSLGVVAYEALAGKRPFTGPSAVDIAVAHVNDPVPPLPPHVSRPVKDVVMRLLAKDPSARPPSAGALARTLDTITGHTPPDGSPAADAPPTTTPSPTLAPPEPEPEPAPAHASGHATGHGPPPSYPPRRALRDPRTGSTGTQRPSVPRHPTGDVGTAGSASSGRGPAGRPPSPPGWAGAPRAPSSPGRAGATSPPTRLPTGQPGTRHDTGRARDRRPAVQPPSTGAGPAGQRSAGRPATGPGGAGMLATPTRTSTTTGRRFGRFGRWSWPLIGLVVLLVALLGAALADSVGGPDGGAAGAGVAGPRVPTREAPEGVARSGGAMIDAGAGPEHRTARTLSTDKDA